MIKFTFTDLRLFYIDIEFEIKNIDEIPYAKDKEIIETIKSIGCLATSNSNKEIIFSPQQIGSFLIEIVNNYNLIKKIILCDYMTSSYKEMQKWKDKDKMLKDKFKDNYDTYIEERKELEKDIKSYCCDIIGKLLDNLEKLNPKLFIFRQCISEYMYKACSSYDNELEDLKKAIHSLELIKNRNEKLEMVYLNQKQQLKEKDSIDYLLHLLANAVWKFVNDFLNGKQLIEKSFIHNDNTRNNKFSGIQATLPITKIEYKLDGFKCPTPFKYIYEIKSIEDLFNVTIYQLTLNRKVIIKCKNCGKYIIPDRTDRQFCNQNCKWRYMSRKSKERESKAYEYYRKLYNRYKNNKTYEKVFQELKNIYYDKYVTKQITDDEFLKNLLDFEEKVSHTYTIKRGRPKKV